MSTTLNAFAEYGDITEEGRRAEKIPVEAMLDKGYVYLPCLQIWYRPGKARPGSWIKTLCDGCYDNKI